MKLCTFVISIDDVNVLLLSFDALYPRATIFCISKGFFNWNNFKRINDVDVISHTCSLLLMFPCRNLILRLFISPHFSSTYHDFCIMEIRF